MLCVVGHYAYNLCPFSVVFGGKWPEYRKIEEAYCRPQTGRLAQETACYMRTVVTLTTLPSYRSKVWLFVLLRALAGIKDVVS